MSIEVKVPQLPESVTDATLVAWHKQPGDTVSRDENLVDLETDKVVLEVPSPTDGIIKEIRVADGTTVAPASMARAAVASDEPSSMTTTSAPGAWVRTEAITSASCASSLNAGTIMTTF